MTANRTRKTTRRAPRVRRDVRGYCLASLPDTTRHPTPVNGYQSRGGDTSGRTITGALSKPECRTARNRVDMVPPRLARRTAHRCCTGPHYANPQETYAPFVGTRQTLSIHIGWGLTCADRPADPKASGAT